MTAYNSKFPWASYYGHYQFFEARMRTHSKISSIKSIGDGLYELTLHSGSRLMTFICECYSFGQAEYLEMTSNLGKIDIVVINSNWCGYTSDVKFACRSNKIGVFTIAELMAALNRSDYWMYLSDFQKDYYHKNGLI